MKNNIQFPECWEEINTKEWIYLLKLRQKLIKGGKTLDDVNKEWTRFILKRRGYKCYEKDLMILINDLADTLGWVWNVKGNEVELSYDITDNLIPQIGKLYGPSSHGSDMTFGEFRTCVNFMNVYSNTHRIDVLYALIGCLYRKKNKGKREIFDSTQISIYAARAYRIRDYLKWGIYAWFASFCSYLISGTFIIDGNEYCFSPLFSSKGEGDDGNESNSLGLTSILFSVAESGVFGSISSCDNTPLLTILLKLLDDYNKSQSILNSIKK